MRKMRPWDLLDNYASMAYLEHMEDAKKTNFVPLHIWIAENGDRVARETLCREAVMDPSTLSRILKGHMPRFEIRYRIYKLTGIKLSDGDDFPVLNVNAS